MSYLYVINIILVTDEPKFVSSLTFNHSLTNISFLFILYSIILMEVDPFEIKEENSNISFYFHDLRKYGDFFIRNRDALTINISMKGSKKHTC